MPKHDINSKYGRLVYPHKLHEEETRLGYRILSFMVFFLSIMVTLLFIDIYFYYSEPSSQIETSPILMNSLFYLLGIIIFMEPINKYTFEIYENGFVLPRWAYFTVFERKGNLVPWAEVKALRIAKVATGDPNFPQYPRLRLELNDGRTVDFNKQDDSDILSLAKIIRTKRPDAIGPELETFVGPKEKRHIRKEPSSSVYEGYIKAIFAIIILVIGLLLSTLVFRSEDIIGPDRIVSAVLMSFSYIMIFQFLFLALMFQRSAERKFIEQNIELTTEGMKIPNIGLGVLVRKVRSSLPYENIRALHIRLGPNFFHYGTFETHDEKEYRINYEFYEKAKELSHFKDNDGDLINPTPSGQMEPITGWNWAGVLGISLLYVVLPAIQLIIF